MNPIENVNWLQARPLDLDLVLNHERQALNDHLQPMEARRAIVYLAAVVKRLHQQANESPEQREPVRNLDLVSFAMEQERMLKEKEVEKLSEFGHYSKIEVAQLAKGVDAQYGQLRRALVKTNGVRSEVRKRCVHLANFTMMLWTRHQEEQDAK